MGAGVGGEDFEMLAGEGHAEDVAGGEGEATGVAVEIELDAADTVVASVNDFRTDESMREAEIEVEVVRFAFVHQGLGKRGGNVVAVDQRADNNN